MIGSTTDLLRRPDRVNAGARVSDPLCASTVPAGKLPSLLASTASPKPKADKMSALRLSAVLCTLCAFQAIDLSAAISPRPGSWASYVEADFPFYSSVVDARRLAADDW